MRHLLPINRKKLKIKRWHFELFILGVLLIPIMFFILWMEQTSEIANTAVKTQTLMLGIAAGVMGTAIWFLGVSVLAINLLKELLEEVREIKKIIGK